MGLFLVDTVYSNYQRLDYGVSFKNFEGSTPIKCDDLRFVGFYYDKWALFKCPKDKLHFVRLGTNSLSHWNPSQPPKLYRQNYDAMHKFSLGNDDAFFRVAGRLNQFGKAKTVKVEEIPNYSAFLRLSYAGRKVCTVYNGNLYLINKTPFNHDPYGDNYYIPRKKIQQLNYEGKTIKIVQLPDENLTIPIDIMDDLSNMLGDNNTQGYSP